MRFALFSIAGLLVAPSLLAQAPPGNALTVLNEYLEQAAADVPAYRADIRTAGSAQDVPPGRLLGFSSILGPFTYRARRYGELSMAEREALLASPAFHAFLISRRPPASNPAPLQISLSPEDMLRLGPLFVGTSASR